MNVKKTVAVTAGVVVLLVLALVGTLLLPAFQRWLALRIVNGQPGVHLEAEYLHLGPSGFSATQVHFEKDGLLVDADSVDAGFSPLQAAGGKKIDVQSLEVHGVKLDLTHYQPKTTTALAAEAKPKEPASPQAFRGVLNQIQLPVDVSLGTVAIDGTAIASAAPGQPPLTTTFRLTGGGLAAGQTGTFKLEATVVDPSPKASVSQLALEAALKLTATNERTFSAILLNFTVRPQGQLFQQRAETLQGTVDLQKTASGEHYAISATDGNRSKPLLGVTADYAYTGNHLQGKWTLAAAKNQIAPYLLGLSLPDFSADGKGQFVLDAQTFANASVQGQLAIDASHFEALSPDLHAIGALKTVSHFDLGYAAGQAKLNQFSLTISGLKPVVAVESLQAVTFDTARKTLTYAKPDSDFVRIDLSGVPLAWVAPFAKDAALTGSDLHGQIAVSPQGDGFILKATQPIAIDALTFEQKGQSPLLKNAAIRLNPTINYSAAAVVAHIPELSLRTPDGDAVTIALDATRPADAHAPLTFNVTLQAKLLKLLASYAAVPPVGAQSTVQGSLQDNTLAVQKLEFAVDDTQGHALLSVRGEQPFTFDTITHRVIPQSADKDVASVNFGRVPLGLAAPFVPAMKPSGEIASGQIAVGVSGETIRFKTPAPLQIARLGFTLNGQPALAGLDVATEFDGIYSPQALRISAGKLTVKSGTSTALEINAQADLALAHAPMSGNAKVSVTADLPSLLAQPIAASAVPLSRGKFTADLTLTSDAATTVNGQVSLANLVAKEGGQALPTLLTQLKAVLGADGSIDLNAPLTVDASGRKSDLALTAKVSSPANQVRKFAVQLTGQNLFVDDFMILAALAPAKGTSPTATSGATPESPKNSPLPASKQPDKQPFWAGNLGTAKLDLKHIVYGTYDVTEIVGSATSDTNKLTTVLNAKLGDHPLKLGGQVAFDSHQHLPYTLSAELDAAGIDAGKFLRANNPSQPPKLEAVFTVKSTLNSQGINLADLIERVSGQADVSADNGICRLYDLKIAKIASFGTKAYGIISGSQNAKAIGELGSYLAEFPFDKLTLHLARDTSLNIKVTNLRMESASLRAEGSGQVSYISGKPLANYPLLLKVDLFARNDVAVLFSHLRMLAESARADDSYRVDPTFTIAGTVGQPDTSQINRALEAAGLKAAAPSLLNLLPH